MNGYYQIGDVVLGNWTLVKLLGEGSYGKVYEAERVDFGMTYRSAIKIVTIPQSQSEIADAVAEGMDEESVTTYFTGFVSELVQEFALMSELKGTANVVSYEDHSVIRHDDGIGWDIIIRMELLTPLMDRMKDSKLTRRDVMKLGIDICRALELCQRFNIIHRDIKPENIFVSRLGDYKLGDFGIARTVEKTTGGLSKKGTYTYMAPEVYREEPYNSSVDTYSLGIVLYRLLNDNRAPFLPPYPAPIKHSDRDDALRRRLLGENLPTPKNADGRLAEIVLKACAYDPQARYSSPMQMRQELEAILPDRESSVSLRAAEYADPEATVSVFTAKPHRLSNALPADDARTLDVFGAAEAVTEDAALAVDEISEDDAALGTFSAPIPAAESDDDRTVGIFTERRKPEAKPLPDSDYSVQDGSVLKRSMERVVFEDINAANIGDTISFGTYEQSNTISSSKDNIVWLVLAKANGKILVISKYALICQPYCTSYTNVTWATSSLRSWLNSTFLNNAFSASERAKIATTRVFADKNPRYSTNSGYVTNDKVFLLSITEVEKYFTTDESRKCAPTAYAKAHGAWTSNKTNASGENTSLSWLCSPSYQQNYASLVNSNVSYGNCWWWLRTPGHVGKYAATVGSTGSVNYCGLGVSLGDGAVRPAMWIDPYA